MYQLKNVEHRKALSKLRLSAHNFPIEEGRRHNIPRHLRRCSLCHSSSIGDEYHTLMECINPYLDYLRNEFLYIMKRVVPQFQFLPLKEKFVYIMSCADINCCRIIAPFIHKCIQYVEKSGNGGAHLQ